MMRHQACSMHPAGLHACMNVCTACLPARFQVTSPALAPFCRRPARSVRWAEPHPHSRLPSQCRPVAGLGAVHAAVARVGWHQRRWRWRWRQQRQWQHRRWWQQRQWQQQQRRWWQQQLVTPTAYDDGPLLKLTYDTYTPILFTSAANCTIPVHCFLHRYLLLCKPQRQRRCRIPSRPACSVWTSTCSIPPAHSHNHSRARCHCAQPFIPRILANICNVAPLPPTRLPSGCPMRGACTVLTARRPCAFAASRLAAELSACSGHSSAKCSCTAAPDHVWAAATGTKYQTLQSNCGGRRPVPYRRPQGWRISDAAASYSGSAAVFSRNSVQKGKRRKTAALKGSSLISRQADSKVKSDGQSKQRQAFFVAPKPSISGAHEAAQLGGRTCFQGQRAWPVGGLPQLPSTSGSGIGSGIARLPQPLPQLADLATGGQAQPQQQAPEAGSIQSLDINI